MRQTIEDNYSSGISHMHDGEMRKAKPAADWGNQGECVSMMCLAVGPPPHFFHFVRIGGGEGGSMQNHAKLSFPDTLHFVSSLLQHGRTVNV